MPADQEVIQFLDEFFPADYKGYLVDVGAGEGERGSLTRKLLLRGWSGLLMDPLPANFESLKKLYQGNGRVLVSQSAASDFPGEAEFYPSAQGVSTMEKWWADKCTSWWSHIKYDNPIRVHVVRLGEILRVIGAPSRIDVLKVDTEGHDYKVLQGMDWGRDVRVVVVECALWEGKHDGLWFPPDDVDRLLLGKGFARSMITVEGNTIYVKE